MRKITWLYIFIVVALVCVIVYFAVDVVYAAANRNILTPFSVVLSNSLKGIYANPLWKAYVVPYQFAWGCGATLLIVGVLAWRTGNLKRPTLRKKTVAPSYPTGTTGHSSTPMGATTRPNTETTVDPLAVPPVDETIKPEAT